jgi:transglutaminase-like putative cysteine protease
MLIDYGFDIEVFVAQPTPMITLLDIRPERGADIIADVFSTTPDSDGGHVYTDTFGNICRRFNLQPGVHTFTRRGVITDSGQMDAIDPWARSQPVSALPDEVLNYLLPSRYCDSDVLSTVAVNQFGHLLGGWQQVKAVCDFAHSALVFDYARARPTRSAADALREGTGVCRDYAHLAITLCRALNIPARYATGYLGDIGVPYDPARMDFSAWFEAYNNGVWYTFDARHNRTRIGRVVMAYGRDAADAALITSFGQHVLNRFDVVTQERAGAVEEVTVNAPQMMAAE